MPNKFNADHRHHIPKMRHFVRNWSEYESGLRNRGSLTFWVTPQAMQLWPAQARSTPGGQSIYSNQAIQTSLIVRESKCVTFVMVKVLLGGYRALGGVFWSEIMMAAV